jgi:hypothetical protein
VTSVRKLARGGQGVYRLHHTDLVALGVYVDDDDPERNPMLSEL